ncbi:ParB/RepB/Spo0J family partition protein [Pedobacter sp.]
MSTAVNDRKIVDIQLSQISPNPFNPRTSFSEEELRELSLSISETGVIQAVVLRKVGTKYQTAVGERRIRASRLAGKKTIPAEVRVLSDDEMVDIAIVENLQRSDVPPMEERQPLKISQKRDNMMLPPSVRSSASPKNTSVADWRSMTFWKNLKRFFPQR